MLSKPLPYYREAKMKEMLVVCSNADPASLNIRDRMLEVGTFEEVASFDRFPVYEGHGGYLVTIGDDSLYRNNLDAETYGSFGFKPRTVVYLSRHSSQSGRRSLTVHPIGNFSHARYGGFFRQLVHCCPGGMTRALRSMHAQVKEAGLDYDVSFEVTHHGPYLNTPTFFIEIGSDKEAWTEPEPAGVIAKAVLEAEPRGEGLVLLGVGGGHYAPRHTDVALKKAVSYSHIIPSHSIAGLGTQLLEEMLDYVCESRHIYFHRKAMGKEDLKRLTEFYKAHGLEAIREADLPDLPDPD